MNRIALFAWLSLVLSACADDPVIPQPPAPLPPTQVELHIDGDASLNLDASGKASPVMFRVYELRELSDFNGADFFALLEKDQATLSSAMARKQEFPLKISESKKITLSPSDDVKAISFFAAFRKLDNAQWRASSEIKSHHNHKILVKVKNNQVIVDKVEIEKPEPPAPPKTED